MMLLRTRKAENIVKILKNQLGQALNTKQVSEYLGLDPKTVRKYYRELGGIRLGRHYRFFEKEICNAIQKQKWNKMDCPSEEQLIRMKLQKFDEIKSLEFDIANRKLTVHHIAESQPILSALETLNLDTTLMQLLNQDYQ